MAFCLPTRMMVLSVYLAAWWISFLNYRLNDCLDEWLKWWLVVLEIACVARWWIEPLYASRDCLVFHPSLCELINTPTYYMEKAVDHGNNTKKCKGLVLSKSLLMHFCHVITLFFLNLHDTYLLTWLKLFFSIIRQRFSCRDSSLSKVAHFTSKLTVPLLNRAKVPSSFLKY